MRQVSLDQLRPHSAEGLPDVEWGEDAPGPAELYRRYGDQVAGATVASLQYLASAEPGITDDMLRSVPEGCRLDGLAHRMKSPGSLAAKIGRKAERDPDASPYDVSAGITDLLRYTGVAPSAADVVPMARKAVRRLKRRGWTMVEAESSYVAGNPYKGLHTVLRHRETGQEVELQFHSEESIKVKGEWHQAYEVLRDDDRSRAERDQAYKAMASAWAAVPTPPGLDELVLGGLEVTHKVYPNLYDKRAKGRTS